MAMEYMTVKDAAETWNLSVRTVQQYCIAGKVEGAVKLGNTWMIPARTQKPKRRKSVPREQGTGKEEGISRRKISIPMPLLNSSFKPGEAGLTAEKIAAYTSCAIAMGEYYYFSGNPAKAVDAVETYLNSEDVGVRLSACWIYAYASFALDKIENARLAMANIKSMMASVDETTPSDIRTLIFFVATGASVLLHLPLAYELPPMNEIINVLPNGLRLFALYVYAHYAYLQKEYGASAGIAETALALESEIYPIPTIYLHLIAVMDYMCLKKTEEARKHILAAWKIAERDALLEPFAEHHGLVSGMLEATLKKSNPEEFKKIITLTYKFAAGWRKIHNPDTGRNVADTLSTTEFAISMMTSKGYSTKEIAAFLGISENTVKYHISHALGELGISDRRELKRFMLD